MRKISEKDKKIWNYYTSNLNFIKKANKKRFFKSYPLISKVLKSNISFALDPKTKKEINNKKFVIDAMIDLHGKTEVQAYEVIKSFIKNSYLEELKNIIIITGKGVNNQGKLKLKTPFWLRNEEFSKFIVGFETMPNNKGGEGALFVKLKIKINISDMK